MISSLLQRFAGRLPELRRICGHCIRLVVLPGRRQSGVLTDVDVDVIAVLFGQPFGMLHLQERDDDNAPPGGIADD